MLHLHSEKRQKAEKNATLLTEKSFLGHENYIYHPRKQNNNNRNNIDDKIKAENKKIMFLFSGVHTLIRKRIKATEKTSGPNPFP